jgi:hypothetical protein
MHEIESLTRAVIEPSRARDPSGEHMQRVKSLGVWTAEWTVALLICLFVVAGHAFVRLYDWCDKIRSEPHHAGDVAAGDRRIEASKG